MQQRNCRDPGWLVRAALCVLATTTAHADGRDRVRTVGSSTVFPFASAVAEAFGRTGRWKTPIIESTGTGGGFKLFCSRAGLDAADINDASRPMTDRERQACSEHGVAEVTALRIGYDGIVVARSRRPAQFEFTRSQLYNALARKVVFNGRLVDNPYRHWSDIDPRLPKWPISVLGPAPNHGTRDALVALVMVPACEVLPQIRALPREDGAWTDMPGDYSLLVNKLVGNPDAVGIFALAHPDQNRDRIQAARVDGIAPTSASIAAWRYPMSRPVFVYLKTAHVGAVPGLLEFVREFVSERAAGREGYLVEKGLTPLPEPWLAVERAKVEGVAARQR